MTQRLVVQGKAGMQLYGQFEKDRDRGNFELLPELHAILSGMKVCLSPSASAYLLTC